MIESDIFDRIKELGENGFPIFGTCAGMVLLAKEGGKQVQRTGQKLLGLMDMEVCRNAFGRQRESFESEIEIQGIGNYPGIFIRAPVVERVWGKCNVLSTFEGKIIAAQQDNLFATSFHSELTDDLRVHRLFLRIIRR
jgi:5'-phosphate synthase pdxT subunit